MTPDVIVVTALSVLVLCGAVWYFASSGKPRSAPAPRKPLDLVEVFEQAGAAAVNEQIVQHIGKHKARKAMKELAEMFKMVDDADPK